MHNKVSFSYSKFFYQFYIPNKAGFTDIEKTFTEIETPGEIMLHITMGGGGLTVVQHKCSIAQTFSELEHFKNREIDESFG